MQTEDLIEALSRDARAAPVNSAGRMGAYLAAGCAVALVVFLVALGLRPDAASAIGTPWYPLKVALLALTGALAFPLAEAMARPGARAPWRPLLLGAALLAGAVLADLTMLGAPGAPGRMIGENGLYCLMTIQILALGPLVAVLAAMRAGAPTDPAKAGAAAGLLCGAIGGTLYGLHCPDDSPLFVALWYSIALAITASAGAVAGRWALRW